MKLSIWNTDLSTRPLVSAAVQLSRIFGDVAAADLVEEEKHLRTLRVDNRCGCEARVWNPVCTFQRECVVMYSCGTRGTALPGDLVGVYVIRVGSLNIEEFAVRKRSRGIDVRDDYIRCELDQRLIDVFHHHLCRRILTLKPPSRVPNARVGSALIPELDVFVPIYECNICVRVIRLGMTSNACSRAVILPFALQHPLIISVPP